MFFSIRIARNKTFLSEFESHVHTRKLIFYAPHACITCKFLRKMIARLKVKSAFFCWDRDFNPWLSKTENWPLWWKWLNIFELKRNEEETFWRSRFASRTSSPDLINCSENSTLRSNDSGKSWRACLKMNPNDETLGDPHGPSTSA